MENKIKTVIDPGYIKFNNILFSNDLCLFQDNVDKINSSIFTLNKIGNDYNLMNKTWVRHNAISSAFKSKIPLWTIYTYMWTN